MIPYNTGPLALFDLLRVRGSAIYKTILPSLISTGILVGLEATADFHNTLVNTRQWMGHPYVLGAFVAFFSFLLTFRLNFAYGRYWESVTAIHQMLSKWLDVVLAVASFHYQSAQFDHLRPPTFGELSKDTSIVMSRRNIKGLERNFEEMTFEECVQSIKEKRSLDPLDETDELEQLPGTSTSIRSNRKWWNRKRPWRHRSRGGQDADQYTLNGWQTSQKGKNINSADPKVKTGRSDRKIPIPQRFQQQFVAGVVCDDALESEDDEEDVTALLRRQHQLHRKGMKSQKQSQAYRNLMGRQLKVPMPSLFLEEMAHLVSLMAAVSMASLRNDSPCADVPLTEYYPGMQWPAVDPDQLSRDVQIQYDHDNRCVKWIYFCLGLTRTERHRTLYNFARPFAVLGGVSDAEVQMLHEAQGPYAKVAMCSMWVQEFLSREYLDGSTGNVAPPILSRLYQYLSDGVVGYNQARKVAFVPFPFPHAQMTAFFSLFCIGFFPLLFYGFIYNLPFACVVNFLTVMCFLGIHEVAHELENPFTNVPNDIPLTTFQAQFNEALVTIYAGFHPDSWWEVKSKEERQHEAEQIAREIERQESSEAPRGERSMTQEAPLGEEKEPVE